VSVFGTGSFDPAQAGLRAAGLCYR